MMHVNCCNLGDQTIIQLYLEDQDEPPLAVTCCDVRSGDSVNVLERANWPVVL
jgi:hypothetical protein